MPSLNNSRHLVPAPLIFVASALSLYGGAALAVGLFAIFPAPAVAWWRIVIGAIILVPLTRPWRQRLSLRQWGVSAFFGIVTTAMNICFYLSIRDIPLGTAVSLEFIGPIAVAVFTGRGARIRWAAFLAAVGVASIGGIGLNLSDSSQLWGAAFALLSGLFWALYILVGRHVVSSGRSGMTSLAIGLLAGAVVFFPVALPSLHLAWSSWLVALALLGVGVFSSAIPYALEQVAFKRLGTANFSLLASLEPATSVVVGAVLLRQIPNFGEFFGLLAITGAVVLSSGHQGAKLEKFKPKRGTSAPYLDESSGQ